MHCLLADLGQARETRSRPPYTHYVATRWYRAPEIILRATIYNSPCDMFAAGCLIAELHNGRPLFSGKSETDQMHLYVNALGSITAASWPEGARRVKELGARLPQGIAGTGIGSLCPGMPEEGQALVGALLALNPQKRMSAAQAIDHDYFATNRAEEQELRAREQREGGRGSPSSMDGRSPTAITGLDAGGGTAAAGGARAGTGTGAGAGAGARAGAGTGYHHHGRAGSEVPRETGGGAGGGRGFAAFEAQSSHARSSSTPVGGGSRPGASHGGAKDHEMDALNDLLAEAQAMVTESESRPAAGGSGHGSGSGVGNGVTSAMGDPILTPAADSPRGASRAGSGVGVTGVMSGGASRAAAAASGQGTPSGVTSAARGAESPGDTPLSPLGGSGSGSFRLGDSLGDLDALLAQVKGKGSGVAGPGAGSSGQTGVS